MADFWCIPIGLLGFFALCALIAWFTDRRDNAGDDDAEWLHVSGFEFIHIERNNSLSERNNG